MTSGREPEPASAASSSGADRARLLRYGIAVVLVVASLSLLISAQGWKSRLLAFDLLTYYYSAHEFLESGTLPQHGDTGSYGSYKPPGTAWLMLPGTALLGDPRAAAYLGTGLLHLGTLLGLFLLGRRSFGTWPACLAVFLYGFSSHGLFLAGSLWPNGRPDFFVWFVLFITLWALRRDGRFLAAALTVWGVGMNVDMGIAPALFILPVVWLFYRPPMRLLPLAVAGLVVLTVWSPYLRLEATRGFADIQSQLFLRNIQPQQVRQSWCDSSLALVTWQAPAGPGVDRAPATEASGAQPAPIGWGTRLGFLWDKVLSNLTHAVRIPGVPVVLLALLLGAILLCSVPGTVGPGPPVAGGPPLRRWQAPLAGLLLVLGLVLYGAASGLIPGAPLMPGSGLARKAPQLLVLIGISMLGGPWLLAATRRLMDRAGIDLQPTAPMRLLVISLIVPWSILVIVAEPGKPERFWWVWPLQVLLLAAAVAYFLPRLRVPRPIVSAAQLALALLVVLNSFVRGRIESWRADGWSGADPEEVRVIDYVAGRIQSQGGSGAAVGYQLFIYPFMAEYHITNPVYRAGAELELMLWYRHQIRNRNQCAEGIAPTDDYRIVQRRPKGGPQAPQHYFDQPLDQGFRLVRQFGLYDVYERGPPGMVS